MSRQNGAPKNLCDSLDAGSRLQLQDIPQEIRKVSEIFRIKRGKKLYKQGSHNTYIYYLVDGYVVIATEALSDKRDNPIIDIKNAGSWLGLHAYMNNNSPAPDYVYAQTDCTVVRVPLSAVSGSDNMDLISEL
ncbi:cyclic nucleotide-binding domain-containing protein, partial [Candidatus Peregrinibacteria bacterium]|nr:cyclic nucleotide-binding domain-containing protein [Candidatus Peregrinibacteria bacterium]